MNGLLVKLLRCDSCGRETPLADVHGEWVTVTTIVTGPEGMAEMFEAATEGKEPWDAGEFCSLPCLANWASAQAGFREVEGEVEA